MRWEVLPAIFIFGSAFVLYNFKTQFLNLLPSQFEGIDQSQELFISRKLASLLKYQYCLTDGVNDKLIDV